MIKKIKISIIVPTYNRLQWLKLCLKALKNQTIIPEKFEVLIVVDGSKQIANIKYHIASILRKFNYQILTQPHRGVAAARNLGIKKAKGKVVLLMSDDILACKNLIQEHLNFHQKYPADNIAVLGYVPWHPQLKLNLFLEWLYFSGLQADYNSLKDEEVVSFKCFYTSNVSLKKDFLLENGVFDENFKAAYEDTELSYRLKQKGLKIIFCKKALAYNLYPLTLPEFLSKMEATGKAGRFLFQKHPKLKDVIFPTKLPIKEILRLKFWQVLYPLGKIFQNKQILFQNYQRLTNEALLRGYYS